MQRNNQGFFIVIVVILISIVGLFAYVVWGMIHSDVVFLDMRQTTIKTSQNKHSFFDPVLALHLKNNTDGETQDVLSCSGGLIQIEKEDGQMKANCTTVWINGEDGIPDSGDNNDFTSKISQNNIDHLLTPESLKTDNDDWCRKNMFGFIGPGEEKTIFFVNDRVKEFLGFNSNNIGDSLKTKPEFRLDFSLTHADAIFTTYQIDKTKYNEKKDTVVIRERQGGVFALSGALNFEGALDPIGFPYLFQTQDFDYYVTLKNTSETDVLGFEYQAISQTNDELYVTPINDQLGINKIQTLYFEIKKNGENISILEG